MKKYILPIFTFTLFLGACSSAVDSTEKSSPTMSAASKITLDHSLLATNKDLSCGMELGDISDTATYKGKLYGFCSTECKEHFLANPDSLINKK